MSNPTLIQRVRDYVLDGLPQIVDADEREERITEVLAALSPLELLSLVSEVLDRE